MKNKKLITWIIIIAIIIGILCAIFFVKQDKEELISVKSQKELMEIYEGVDIGIPDTLIQILTMPFSLIYDTPRDYATATYDDVITYNKGTISIPQSFDVTESTTSSATTSLASKEYSTTNIQVENVDEADITKTDGDYIYSISGDKVIITNVIDSTDIKIEATIEPNDEYVPEDLLLYGDKLVVISTHYISYNKYNTFVNIYNIETKSKPKLIETFTLYEQYYTSRCIDGKLFIIASGKLREEDDEIVTYYDENNTRKDIGLSNIKYLKGLKTKYQTLIARLDLNTNVDVRVNSYLFNVENAYISEKNMYLLDEEYENTNKISVKDIFGLGGIIGFIKKTEDYNYDYNQKTHIYKFNIEEDGSVELKNNTKVKGTTINQFSLDEYEDNLRVGLYTTEGSRIAVFDENLKLIGETEYLAKGEKMYSTRFVEEKAYMVTYKTIDPLYVIDLSDASNPTVLGKLKIPGYSTYLQPYDENHIIGIGMQTEERVNRNSSGKVISTSAVITGMKMALFDVSDVNNPVQISETIIGDSRTTSAVLTNHKALLFSKEKGIIAIPVNNYSEEFEVSASDTDISSIVNSYTSYNKTYISEGYLVYNINLTDGFNLKGTITHNKSTTKNKYYGYYYTSKMLRGLWIEDNLFTISEDMIKVNKLDNLEEIDSINIFQDLYFFDN